MVSFQLRSFEHHELILSDKDTMTVLRFFFPHHLDVVNSLTADDRVRSFAQAILVVAIDATYAIGFLQSLWQASIDPSSGAAKIIKEFAKEAAVSWFKYATRKELINARIYLLIRDRIQMGCRTELNMLLVRRETKTSLRLALNTANTSLSVIG